MPDWKPEYLVTLREDGFYVEKREREVGTQESASMSIDAKELIEENACRAAKTTYDPLNRGR